MLRLVYLLLRQRLSRRRNAPPEAARPTRRTRWLVGAVIGAAVCGVALLAALMQSRLVPGPGLFQQFESATAKLEIQVDSIDSTPLVAYIDTPGASSSAVPTERNPTVKITSVNNTFQPQFQVAPLATTLEVVNDDPIPHNTHLFDGRYTLFNVATPIPGLRVQKVLGRPGIYHVRCDLHPWMRARIFVPPTRHYRVLWQPERLILADIEPGRYRLSVWEPARGEITRMLDFAPGETKSFALSELHADGS